MTPHPDRGTSRYSAQTEAARAGLLVEVICHIQIEETELSNASAAEAAEGEPVGTRAWRGRMSWTERRFSEALSE